MSRIEELLGRTIVVVAHPDDECIAYGGLLQRMRDAIVVYLTDGSPQDPYFWRAYGSREEYAKMRQRECRAALSRAGVSKVEFLADIAPDLVDQELFRNLPRAYDLLLDRIRVLRPDAIATLAYEGGHPDHDSCNLLCAIAGREAGIPVWEAPLYHRDPSDSSKGTVQAFVSCSGAEERLELSSDELAHKQAMCSEYPSQGDFLATFRLTPEVLRPIAEYDYSRPPHAGLLNYEVWQWSMSAAQVSAAFRDFWHAHFLNHVGSAPGSAQL